MMACSKLLVTKIKYSKFSVNSCKYESKNETKSSIHPPFITTNHMRVTKNYSFQVFAILCYFYYGLILAPILIQIAYAVHTHTQFNMIGKQPYANDCGS